MERELVGDFLFLRIRYVSKFHRLAFVVMTITDFAEMNACVRSDFRRKTGSQG